MQLRLAVAPSTKAKLVSVSMSLATGQPALTAASKDLLMHWLCVYAALTFSVCRVSELFLARTPAVTELRYIPCVQLSRDLISCWIDEYAPALALLRRVLPGGLIRHLNAPFLPPTPVAVQSAPFTLTPSPPPPPQPLQALGTALASVGAAMGDAVGQLGLQANAALGVGDRSMAAGAGGGAAGGAGVRAESAESAQGGAAEAAPGAVQSQPAAAPALHPVPPGDSIAGTQRGGQLTDSRHTEASTQPFRPAGGVPAALLTPTALGADHLVAPIPAAVAITGSTGLKGNWAALWDAVDNDHSHAGLIWWVCHTAPACCV